MGQAWAKLPQCPKKFCIKQQHCHVVHAIVSHKVRLMSTCICWLDTFVRVSNIKRRYHRFTKYLIQARWSHNFLLIKLTSITMVISSKKLMFHDQTRKKLYISMGPVQDIKSLEQNINQHSLITLKK